MQTSYISLSFTTMTNSIKYTAKLSSSLNHPLLECKEGKKNKHKPKNFHISKEFILKLA